VAALALVLGSSISRSRCNCYFPPTGRNTIHSPKQPKMKQMGGKKKKPTQFCILMCFLLNVLEKSRDLESICMGRKCHYVPDFGKIECSFWIPFGIEAIHRNDYLLGFKVLQLTFLITLFGWKIPPSVAQKWLLGSCSSIMPVPSLNVTVFQQSL